ncbi:hypothetical protein L1281_002516 [Neisseria sp. HSC-16F19]|nr:hypothetical protein [Neisseria sp. HSC-16F19]MCP2041898.1 hypothetical protein [Neisseria sp. HSC-16F19]
MQTTALRQAQTLTAALYELKKWLPESERHNLTFLQEHLSNKYNTYCEVLPQHIALECVKQSIVAACGGTFEQWISFNYWRLLNKAA